MQALRNGVMLMSAFRWVYPAFGRPEKLVELGTRTNTGWAKKCLWDGIVQVRHWCSFRCWTTTLAWNY